MKTKHRCACGCGEETCGGTFRQGHDMKLKSVLLSRSRGGRGKVKQNADRKLHELGWA